jgi:hypothetical protein
VLCGPLSDGCAKLKGLSSDERTQLRSALQQHRLGNKPAEDSIRYTASTMLSTWEPATRLSSTSEIDTEAEWVHSLSDGIRRSLLIAPQLDSYSRSQALPATVVPKLPRVNRLRSSGRFSSFGGQSTVRTTARCLRQT